MLRREPKTIWPLGGEEEPEGGADTAAAGDQDIPGGFTFISCVYGFRQAGTLPGRGVRSRLKLQRQER